MPNNNALTDEQIESMAIAHGLYSARKAVVQCVRDLLSAAPPQPVADDAAVPLEPNQIQVTHTIATAENAATILHGLLDSFVEVAAAFPQATIDEALARQALTYMPAAVRGDERAEFEAWWSDNETWPVSVKNLGFLVWQARAAAAQAGAKSALLEAARQVEKWWVSEGAKHFGGAPACMFNLRAAIASNSTNQPEPRGEVTDVQWWLAELDQHGNPKLSDGAHSERAGADKAMYLIKSLDLDNKGKRWAVARVELSEPRPSADGVNKAAVASCRAMVDAARAGESRA